MSTINKTGCTVLLAMSLLASSAIAQAALVNYELTGTVDEWADTPNDFGLNMGDTISATGTFDDSVLSGGTGVISFGSGSGNSMTLVAGSYTFTAADDVNYPIGYPELLLNGGAFDGLNLSIAFGTFGTFDSLDLWFDGFDDSDNLVSGIWTAFQMTPVPVPAAVWLFGSGLLGLVGLARRKKNT